MTRKPSERFTPPFDNIDEQSIEKHVRRNERRRKLGKVALRSLETAFSVMTLVQSSNEAVAIAQELTHDHPAAVSIEDQNRVFASAIEKSHIEYTQKQMDNLAGLEAEQQEHVHAQWHVDTSFNEQPSLYIDPSKDIL